MADLKRVYILGAGASKGHFDSIKSKTSKSSYPNINEFYKEAKKLRITINQNNEVNDCYKELSNFIEEWFGKDIKDGRQNINIEDLLTYIQIELEKGQHSNVAQIKQNIIEIIVEVLYRLQETLDKSRNDGDYHKFYDKINAEKEHNATTIITFNWDLLLDNIIGREGAFKNNQHVDISNSRFPQFNSFMKLTGHAKGRWDTKGNNAPYISRSSSKDNTYYLKLHCSIDWLYCSNDSCEEYGIVYPMSKVMESHNCSICHENVKRLIIPPVLNKQYNFYPFIQRIWNLAGRELASANEIIIWGYSLPPTDFYSNWLMRRNCPRQLDRLILINPDCVTKNKKDIGRPFLKKILDIYKSKLYPKSKPQLYENFEDYYHERNVFSKYSLKTTFKNWMI